MLKENESLHKELKQSCKKSCLDLEDAQAREQEACHLRSTVDKLHRILAQKCDLEGTYKELFGHSTQQIIIFRRKQGVEG